MTMGLQTLQQLIESQFAGACVSVDLLRIASSVSGPYQGRVALSLVVDAECCLDRLYGGYVSGKDMFCSFLFLPHLWILLQISPDPMFTSF